MADQHVRRSGADYAVALANLLPYGPAWPRHPWSILMQVIEGLAGYWGTVDSRAADLLERESDPRYTLELLPDFERNWGLPDPCWKAPQSIDQRHQQLLFKMTLLGGQSREFFIDIAAWLGYTITITEYAPFMAGVSQMGDTRQMDYWDGIPGEDPKEPYYRWYIGGEEQRFFWTVHVANAPLDWFRMGEAEAGIHHHLEIGLPEDLMCLLDRWSPAHTKIVYDFSNLTPESQYAGLP